MREASTHTVTVRERRDRERAVPVRHAHDATTRDPRAVLGNRSARMLLAQPHLVVGASFDPLEVEADRVAADVVRTMAAGPAPDQVDHVDHVDHVDRECGPGCSLHGPGSAVARTISRAPSPEAAPIGAAGGAIQAADEATVKRARGGGAPLPGGFRDRVEPAMGADFSRVRVHTGPVAAQLNRSFGASAFTIGNDIFFRDRMPDVTTTEGARLVTHELTHTIQQGGSAAVSRCCCGSTGERVQRHSSFEHLMLGNVRPVDLAKVGAWKDAIQQTTAKRTGLSKKVRGEGKGGGEDEASVDVTLGGQQYSFSKADILHVLLQEMRRLKEWQSNPPRRGSAGQANQKDQALAPVGADPTFGVVTVRLPQGLLCTYGEMNTLGDYFGSVEVMKGAAEEQVWQLLQSVRKETWGFLTKTFDEVRMSLTKTEMTNQKGALDPIYDTWMEEFWEPEVLEGETTTFAGAMMPVISGKVGQAELLTGVQGTGVQQDIDKYGVSLGRNACHFVPESWHAWANNHKEARRLALESNQARVLSNQAKNQMDTAVNPQAHAQAEKVFKTEKAKSTRLANEALMTNGFGDHFLQDSYASGHMINKTQIMQFYIEYIDAHDQWDYFKDANWRKVQNIAYTQNLAPPTQYDQTRVEGYAGATGANANTGIDPQTVENRKNTKWKQNFTDLGLQVPRSLSNDPTSTTRLVLAEMRAEARTGKDSLKGTEIIAMMNREHGIKARRTRMAVADMLLDGVLLADVDVAKRGRQMASMRDRRAAADAKGAAARSSEGAGEALPPEKFRSGTFRLRPELLPKKGEAPVFKSEAKKQREYAAITYNDYLQFIQSAFLQKSTNALHDTFCANGLTVYDNNGTEIGRVYGDDAMFSANSSMGVAHSGTTSQMSRDAILNVINTGNDGGIAVQSIVDRFPTQVRADVYDSDGKIKTQGAGPMPIEAWHSDKGRGGLQGEANKWIFKSMDWSLLQKAGPGAVGDLGTFFSAPPPHVPF